MNETLLEIKHLIESNPAITFNHIQLKDGIEGGGNFFLNNSHYVKILPKSYSISFLYEVHDIFCNNDFDMFLSTIFPNVISYSDDVIKALKIVHNTIVENLEKLVLFTDIAVKSDSCKGSITIIFDKNKNIFDSIAMTGLLACNFKNKSSCFYNIKYSYGSVDNFYFILSKDMVSKKLTKFSNNIFICLIDAKMADAFSDIYVDYTKEDLNNVKMLHGMISI